MSDRQGTILLIHGTGVRFTEIDPEVRETAAAAGIRGQVVAPPWGMALGVNFPGLSLPDGPGPEWLQQEEEDYARWGWLFEDPAYELKQMAIPPDTGDVPPTLAWRQQLTAIRAYTPGNNVGTLLDRTGLRPQWAESFKRLMGEDCTEPAFQASATELPDVCRVLARAIVAELHRRAMLDGLPLPNRQDRNAMVEMLLSEWGVQIFGLRERAMRIIASAATRQIRQNRARVNEQAGRPIGDILLYQARYQEIHDYLRQAIADAAPPVLLIGHSLGGIACVDLLASDNPPDVAGLVTVGSQAPMLHEMRALTSLRQREGLPPHFPNWLNVFDRNDFLSFVAERLFTGRATDREVSSGLPFPESHSAYFRNKAFWTEVATFATDCGA